MKEKTYDSDCYDLALKFVQDVAQEKGWKLDEIAEHTHKLAQDIQQTIEDYLNE